MPSKFLFKVYCGYLLEGNQSAIILYYFMETAWGDFETKRDLGGAMILLCSSLDC